VQATTLRAYLVRAGPNLSQHPIHPTIISRYRQPLRCWGPATGDPFKMGWSKSTRIIVMIVLDTVFFVAELGVGYWVGSLALIADAFHMVRSSFCGSIASGAALTALLRS